ncbi:hypothetical protein B296_00033001 [Ensete ventricosum]|nr:hypothetical protein B296_00033001 [Ensete ventricosum]
MVVIDRTARAKHAMVWALTHVANKGDVMTLLHVLPPHCSASAHREEETSHLLNSLGSLCKAMRPQVMARAGPSPSPFHEDFVEQCISRAECLTMAVRKQSSGVGGYLVSTRWQKNFWLLA